MTSFRTPRRVVVAAAAALVFAATGTLAASATGGGHPPTEITLPAGFVPEGIDTGPGPFAYIGSFADGSIYRADLRTGTGEVLVPGSGVPTLGVETDRRGRLFAAGASAGTVRVIDSRTGSLLKTYQLVDQTGLVNDIVITRDAVYLTDSFKAQLYVLPLGPGGALPDQADVKVLPLTGDFELVTGEFVYNANGIETTQDGDALLVVQTETGLLFRVDPVTGLATTVDLGGELLEGADGLTRDGNMLYVASYSTDTVAVVDLAADGTTGQVVRRISDERFDVPTTTATRGGHLYVVNSRFLTPVTPQTTYSVSIVRR